MGANTDCEVIFVDRFNGSAWIDGVLRVDDANVLFMDHSKKYELRLELCLIDTVERHSLTVSGTPLTIKSKDFRVSCFIFRKNNSCLEFCDRLKQLRQIYKIDQLPCFTRWPSDHDKRPDDGWNRFDLRADFARMGLPNSAWIDVNNQNYEFCDTYPSVLFVPKLASHDTVLGSASFRSRRRLPILTWIHPNGRFVICRSSQPLTGLRDKNKDDQDLLTEIRLAGKDRVASSPPLYVIDTRPRLNALTNRARGKGYEDESVYDDITFRFVEIPNIHVVRKSMEKILSSYLMPRATVMELNRAVDKSEWLRILRRIIEAAYFIASRLASNDKNSCFSFLVHCSDGWDRTAQVCSLAQLLIDPYYRTFNGFQALIEKDWLHFGHKFGSRCGQTQSVDSKEISPVFTQFLDCVRHLMEFLPTSFEFNSRFLAALHDHAHSGVFGTFIGCSEKERMLNHLAERTPSSWTYFANRRSLYLNPLYETPEDYIKAAESLKDKPPHLVSLLPSFVTSPHLFGVWKDLFLQYEWRIPHTSQRMQEALKNLRTQTLALKVHAERLRKRIHEIGKLLGKSDEEINKLVFRGKEPNIPVSSGSKQRGENQQNNKNNCESLSQSTIMEEMQQTYTKPVSRLIPGISDTCHSCNVLLITRTPCVLCSRCGQLVCLVCHTFINSSPDSELDIPLCRGCHFVLTSSRT